MTRWNMPKWTLALVGAVSLLSWWADAGWCASRHGQVPLELRQSYPPPGVFGFCCPPNVRNFGHHCTTWRQWPGQKHLEQTNPRELGAEVLPTPEGYKEEPLPKYVIPHEPQEPEEYYPPQDTRDYVPPPPQAIPSNPLIPLVPEEPEQAEESGQIVPPEGLLIPKRPPEESLGRPKPTEPSTPPSGGGLPGLPGLTPEAEEPAPREDADKTFETRARELPLLRLAEPQSRPAAHPAGSARAAVYVRGQESLTTSTQQASPPTNDVVRLGETESRYAVRVEPAGYVMAESPPATDIQRTTMPSVALDGYCPVALSLQGRWTPGNLRWTVVHKGWIYRLSGDEQRRQFLEDPDRFAPAYSCNDPVLLADQRRAVPGQVSHCAQYDGRLYMFTGEATQEKFNADPGRYAVTE